MPLLRKKADITTPFRKNDTVMATEDLPGIPSGTAGKVKLVNGLDWIRYWVFFENGVDMGSIDFEKLVRPDHWDEFHQRAEERIVAAAAAAEAAAAGITADAGAEAAGGAAEIDPNDPLAAIKALVPPHLLERSAAARVRLGA